VAGKKTLLKIWAFEIPAHIELLLVVEHRIRPDYIRSGRYLIPELFGDHKGNLFFNFRHP